MSIWQDISRKPEEFAYRPFIGWRHIQSEGAKIDSEGFRVTPGSGIGPEIAMFGGSGMWGLGVPDNETIPSAFARLAPKNSVKNYAEFAWTVRQGLGQLVSLIAKRRTLPVVLAYDGYNDVTFMCDRANVVPGTGWDRRIAGALKDRHGGIWRNIVEPVVDALPDPFGERESDRYICASDSVRARAVADNLISTWRIAATIVTAEGGQFEAFLQPTAFFGQADVSHLPEDLNQKTKRWNIYAAEFAAVYPLIQERLRGTSWFTDLTGVIDNAGETYLDSVHLDSEGNSLVARQMFDALRRDHPNAIAMTTSVTPASPTTPTLPLGQQPRPNP